MNSPATFANIPLAIIPFEQTISVKGAALTAELLFAWGGKVKAWIVAHHIILRPREGEWSVPDPGLGINSKI